MATNYYGRCYKYRSFGDVDSAQRSHLFDLLVRRGMMFSSPSKFNDPYDCNPLFIRGSDPAKDRALIGKDWDEGRKRAAIPKPPRKERERRITEIMTKLSTPQGASDAFKPHLDQKTGVFCMSKDWRLLTQWAYYADSGKGLCLEYEVRQGEFDIAYEVEYNNERPKVEIARLLADEQYRKEALFTSIIRKATDWKHEQEVRGFQRGPGIYSHPEDMLTAIMIGLAAEPTDVKWLIDVLRDSGITVPIYQTELNAETYELQRRLIAER